MRKRSIAFAFGVSLLTFLVLLTMNYYDKKLSELTTSDLLFFSIWSTVAGAIVIFTSWVLLIAFKKVRKPDRPKFYNISGALFLLFAIILYLHVKDIPLEDLTMATFLSVLVFYISPIIFCLFILTRKISLLFSFGISLTVFLILLAVNYYDKIFVDLTTSDLLFFSIWSTVAGGIGVFIYFTFSHRVGDLNISGAFILVFASLLYCHTGSVTFDEIIMSAFISALTFFALFFVLGLFVIIVLFNHYKKKSKWV